MSSSPQAPTPTDPNTVAKNQQTINTNAAETSQQGSMVNQSNPYSSLNYNQTGTSANGTPLYTASTTLNPAQQQLLDVLNGTKSSAGQQGNALISGANYGATTPAAAIGDATKGLTGQAVQQEAAYLQPFFKPQTDQLDTQLRNQGFDPSSPAYQQAMNNLKQSQGQTETGFIANIEPQMYQQAYQNYMTPANLGASLANFGSPTTGNLVQTPQLNVAPADLTSATANYNTANQASYQSQLAQNQAMMSGLFGIGTTALGVMGAPFTGGLSLGLLGASQLGGTPGTSVGGMTGPSSYGGSSGPTPLVG